MHGPIIFGELFQCSVILELELSESKSNDYFGDGTFLPKLTGTHRISRKHACGLPSRPQYFPNKCLIALNVLEKRMNNCWALHL